MNLRTIREETLMKTALYPYNLTKCIRPAHRLIAWCAPLFLLLALAQSAAVAATVIAALLITGLVWLFFSQHGYTMGF